jgi:hypothetical protein
MNVEFPSLAKLTTQFPSEVKMSKVICAAILSLTVIPLVNAQDKYDAKDFFGGPNSQKLIVITVADPDTLLFNEKDNDKYCLDGSRLILDADNVEVKGKAVVSSFCGSQGKGQDQLKPGQPGASQPKAGTGCGEYQVHGCRGATGGPADDGLQGGPGTDGGFIRLRVVNISGAGTLTFSGNGSEGGHGGIGGVGGNGGEGGDGKDRTCQTVCGQAGIGGDCGKGGAGGIGGQGGNSSQIEYLKTMVPLIGTKLFLIANGGFGGFGGPGGPAGKKGGPGTAGGGNICGGGCSGNEQPGRCGPDDVGYSREKERGPSGASLPPVEIISLQEPYRPKTVKPTKSPKSD